MRCTMSWARASSVLMSGPVTSVESIAAPSCERSRLTISSEWTSSLRIHNPASSSTLSTVQIDENRFRRKTPKSWLESNGFMCRVRVPGGAGT